MGDLPDDVVYKIVRGNAIRMLSLDLDVTQQQRARPAGPSASIR